MKRNCAVCGSPEKKHIYEQRLVLPSTNYFHDGYDVVICKRCGFAFADNVPDQSFLDEYYRQMTKKTSLLKRGMSEGYLEPQFLVRQHAHSLNNMLPCLSNGDRVLDVGCYTGSLLHMLKQRGFSHLLGLDPSNFAAQVAKEKYGIEVVVGSLFDDLNIGTFDFVILTHVLEHIADLGTFLFKISSLLNDGGKLYIEVPDAHNFFLSSDPSDQYQVEHKEPFLQFSVEHVNYFTSISLPNLMRQTGFDKVSLESQVSTVSIIASVWTQNSLHRDSRIEDHLNKYIGDSKSMYGAVLSIIDEITRSGKEMFVWGAGLHTQKLLASGSLIGANIRAFIDSDVGYHGGTLIGKPIIGPEELETLPVLPILISSRSYQDEIEKQIKDSGFENEITLLYKKGTG